MTNFTYTIFDGNPSEAGPCAWPHHDGEALDAETLDDAVTEVEAIVVSEAKDCGEYAPGQRLWYTIWNADDTIARTGSITLPTVERIEVDGRGGTSWDVKIVMSDGGVVDTRGYMEFGDIDDDGQWTGDEDQLKAAAREYARDNARTHHYDLTNAIPDNIEVRQ